MSISQVPQNEKFKVFIRLLISNEKFEIACSKSGIKKSDAKNFLAQ